VNGGAATDFEQKYQNRFPHCLFFPYISGFFRIARFTAQKQNCKKLKKKKSDRSPYIDRSLSFSLVY